MNIKKLKKNKMFTKLLAIIISIFVLNSFVINDCLYAFITTIPITNTQQTVINPELASITDVFIGNNKNNKQIIFVQDLHTNTSVQKNISEILTNLDKEYGIDTILLEGVPSGKANLSALKSIKDFNIDKELMSNNVLSGPEFFILNNETKANIYGLENWDSYLDNIKRASQILQSNNTNSKIYDELQKNIYKKISNYKKLQKYIDLNFSNTKLLKYINQPILKYSELYKYISINNNINGINKTLLNKQYLAFLGELKSKLDFKIYSNLIKLSKKDNLNEYYGLLYDEILKFDYANKYKELYQFLQSTVEKENINFISLISQQNQYFNDYLNSLSNNKTQQDMFVLKMTQLLKDFINLSISYENYNFFINNYERYINLLKVYLAEDYYNYTDLLFDDDIFDYHQVNNDRNISFINNIQESLNNKKDNNKLTVVVAGGFHTSILNKLKEEDVSYVSITPTINGKSDSKFYNDILLSTSMDFATNALSPIRVMLLNLETIPKNTIELFCDKLVETLINYQDKTPEEIKNIIDKLVQKHLIFGIPIRTTVSDTGFTISIDEENLDFVVKDNKVLWEDSVRYSKIDDENDDSFIDRTIRNLKKDFNVFQAASMKLSEKSPFASKMFTKRLGKRKDIMFNLSMLFSLFKGDKARDISYNFMMGLSSLEKVSPTTFSVNFDEEAVFDDIRNTETFKDLKGKQIEIVLEGEIEQYVSREDILLILKQSIKRVDSIKNIRPKIFIGFVSRSTNLFEDHLNNGFIGINEGLFKLQPKEDTTEEAENDFNIVKKAVIRAGITHELAHELRGNLTTKEYRSFEEDMMFSDIKYIIDSVSEIKYGKKIDSVDNKIEYSKMLQMIVDTLTTPIENKNLQKQVPLFDSNSRFIKKFKHYRHSIEEISDFLIRKDFSIEDRKGQRDSILREYLNDDVSAQEKLFSLLIKSKESIESDKESLEEFLEKHISKERTKEIQVKINTLISKMEKLLSDSGLSETDPEMSDKIITDFKNTLLGDKDKNIPSCLEVMYKKMPHWMFGCFYNDDSVIPDHALNHSLEILDYAIQILAKDTASIKNTGNGEPIDMKAFVYSVFFHDSSCILFRLNHEKNSAIWAKTLLTDELPAEEVDKIYNICLGHRKVKEGKIRDEHKKFFEARLIHDADGFSAVLNLNRILGVWLDLRDPFFKEKNTKEKRIELVNENKYQSKYGGDAVNDLIRQFARRNPDLYITIGAKDYIDVSKTKVSTLRDFISSKETIETLAKYGILTLPEDYSYDDFIGDGIYAKDPYIKSIQETIDSILSDSTLASCIPNYMKRVQDEKDEERQKTLEEQGFELLKIDENITFAKQKESEYNLSAKVSLFIYVVSERIKMVSKNQTLNALIDRMVKRLKRIILVLSDIHGGYKRLAELLGKTLDPYFEDIDDKSVSQVGTTLTNRINQKEDLDLYILGDLLDRGDNQVEAFQLISELEKTRKMRYVIGNHDIYAFMNLLGVHLPSYPNFKGIDNSYTDFKGTNIISLLEQKKEEELTKKTQALILQSHWAKKVQEYMEYSDKEQKKWSEKESSLQKLFTDTFSFPFEKKGNDFLNNPIKFFKEAEASKDKEGTPFYNKTDKEIAQLNKLANDETFINFNKKFFGRNVGVVVYTGIRAVNKMSINWWLDRQKELNILKNKPEYQQYSKYWETLDTEINSIIEQLKEKYTLEVDNGNWEWGVVDAIMYRNYESTEWNALDWSYHNNWGGGKDGFIAQRNKQLRAQNNLEIDHTTYLSDPLIKNLRNFYQRNFFLYRRDRLGIYYMHSILPVDENTGKVSIGYVDENGIFHDRDEKGKRIDGFIYKGKHYKGRTVFKGLQVMAKDIRDYDTSSNNLSEIIEALTILTAIYADNTTRIKPANLKRLKEKHGSFAKILPQGAKMVVVGHNPISKMDSQYEYGDLKFFNKKYETISLIHIDGNMSSGYAAPRGAGEITRIDTKNARIVSERFVDGYATEIVASAENDVPADIFINSLCLNLFPFRKNLLLLTEKIYNKILLIDSFLKNNLLNRKNTSLVRIFKGVSPEELSDLLKMEENFNLKGLKTLAIIPKNLNFDLIQKLNIKLTARLNRTINVKGFDINVVINFNSMLIGNGKSINFISYNYQEQSDISKEEIEKEINKYILEQIKDNKYVEQGIKATKHILVDSSVDDSFEENTRFLSNKFKILISELFSFQIPTLYDLRMPKALDVSDLSTDINLDKIKDILSAA